ncbi:MAG: type II toxin-antitoxin system RelE/ParE family toxin [Vicinamibacteria bacterium]
MAIDAIHQARSLQDLRLPAGNRLEALKGARSGYFSIRVNDRYRITFRFEEGKADDVACEDYHGWTAIRPVVAYRWSHRFSPPAKAVGRDARRPGSLRGFDSCRRESRAARPPRHLSRFPRRPASESRHVPA